MRKKREKILNIVTYLDLTLMMITPYDVEPTMLVREGILTPPSSLLRCRGVDRSRWVKIRFVAPNNWVHFSASTGFGRGLDWTTEQRLRHTRGNRLILSGNAVVIEKKVMIWVTDEWNDDHVLSIIQKFSQRQWEVPKNPENLMNRRPNSQKPTQKSGLYGPKTYPKMRHVPVWLYRGVPPRACLPIAASSFLSPTTI